MIRIKTLLAAAAALASMTLSHGVAADYKDFTGNACRPYFANTGAVIDSTADGAYNRGPGAWVSCPLVRDDHVNPSNGTAAFWVNVLAPDPALPIECSVQSRGSNISWLETHTERTVNQFDRWLWLDVSVGQTWGSYVLYCWMPPGSYIHAYFMDEFQEE